MATLLHSFSAWSDGSLREFQIEPEPIPDDNLFRVRDDTTSPYTGKKPREIVRPDGTILAGPPMPFPAYTTASTTSGTHRTNMSPYGWEEYLRMLNGEKFDQAVGSDLAMFNNRNGEGWPQMESLIFGCNLVRAKQAVILKDGEWITKPEWAQIVTLDYFAGPPVGYPTFAEDPVAVQKFTVIWREGVVGSRELYYPVVCKFPIYMPWSWLEKVTSGMVTQPPP